MKYLSLFIVSFLIVSCGSDDSDDNENQTCTTLDYTITDGVLEGDLFLRSQEDIDAFDWSCIHTVTGRLYISTVSPSLDEPISDISSLTVLERVGGLVVSGNELLTSLDGLQNITTFHPNGERIISVGNNPLLTSLNGLQNFPEFVGRLSITENEGLSTLDALSQITHAEVVTVSENPNLASLMGIHNISFVNAIYIRGNNSLINLVGIPSFNAIQSLEETTLKYLTIAENNSLVSLEGVSGTELDGKLNIYNNDNLNTISHLGNLTKTDRIDLDENDLITSLEGFESLIFVDGPLQIFRNESLNNFCAIETLVNFGTLTGPLGINQCAYNPSLEDIEMGNCSN